MSSLTPAHLDHSRIWREFDFCYPVISRRSKGLSLGVNLNPKKVCNFDCVYCEVDKKKPSRRSDVDLGQLESELRALIKLATSGELFEVRPFSATKMEARRLNDFAFSGDGEPTMATEFPQAVGRLAGIKRSLGLTDVKLVLITNATRLQDSHVIGGIDAMMENNGEIWAKLDGGSEARCRAVNRSAISLDEIIANLQFAGRRWPLIIQTMFLEWNGIAPDSHELRQYLGRLKQLAEGGAMISGLQIYTIARPTPEIGARPLPNEALDDLASEIEKELLGIPVEVFYGSLSELRT